MRDGETKQEYAFRRTFLLIKGDVSDNLVQRLISYINGLTDKELDVYIRLAENLYDRRHLGARSIKVSDNAIKLCLKLAEYDTKTFPYIKKIATKGCCKSPPMGCLPMVPPGAASMGWLLMCAFP